MTDTPPDVDRLAALISDGYADILDPYDLAQRIIDSDLLATTETVEPLRTRLHAAETAATQLNATIERVRALADRWSHVAGRMNAAHELRAALAQPATQEADR